MIDLSITLLIILGGFGALVAMAWVLHWILDRTVGVMMRGQRSGVPQVSERTGVFGTLPAVPPWIEETDAEFSASEYNVAIQITRCDALENGVYRKSYHFSRPIAGVDRIDSFGGEVLSPGCGQLSPDGRYLFITDEHNILLFDLQRNRVFHRQDTSDRRYFSAARCGRFVQYKQNDCSGNRVSEESIVFGADGEVDPAFQWTYSADGNHTQGRQCTSDCLPVQLSPPCQVLWTVETPDGLVSAPYNFQMHIERKESASDKAYSFSRPIAGIDVLHCRASRRGNSQLSPDGRYLLIVDESEFWLFDIKESRVFHQTASEPWLLFFMDRCHGRTAIVGEDDDRPRANACYLLRVEIDEDGKLLPPNKWDP